MIPDIRGNAESVKDDPGDLARVLELELLQKRAAWQRKSARYRVIRAMSIFLMVVLVAALAAGFFFVLWRYSGERQHRKPPGNVEATSDH